MSIFNFGGVAENVVTRSEFPLEKAKEILKNETMSVIGYGVQGPAQALNLRDNGVRVIVGQRKGTSSWNKAMSDGWTKGKDLFEIDEASAKGTIVMNLLSDAGQLHTWAEIKPHLSSGKSLYFSHGFGLTFRDKTGIHPPADVDVFLVAPKGSGTTLRSHFLKGRGVNSSYALYRNASGNAREKAIAIGMAIGSGYLFETTFEKEVYSDLTGERGILMGALAGVLEAQYNVLRANGHSPSEAFNETVEELTQSLMPLVAEKGMDWMFANTSVTAQRGALDWKNRFRDALSPLFNELYDSVITGKEADRVITEGMKPGYREKLEEELNEIRQSELWRTGSEVRNLRP